MRPLSCFFIALLPLTAFGAPGVSDKPKWEYAELSIRATSRPLPKDANEAAAPQPPTIRWLAGMDEVDFKGYAEFAEKFKIANFKKEASVNVQRLQLLNYLGSEGWELMSATGTTATGFPSGRGTGPGTTTPMVFTFKRRVQ
jgi:hypothetical protein